MSDRIPPRPDPGMDYTANRELSRAQFLSGYFAPAAGEPDPKPTAAELVEAEAAFDQWWRDAGQLCDRCRRPGYYGRLLRMGKDELSCIDCFAFLTGIDPRDPLTDATARSGGRHYLTLDEWRDRGEPSVPAGEPIHVQRYDWTEQRWRDVDERPIGAPLPPGSPWWARLLHWLGIEMVGQR